MEILDDLRIKFTFDILNGWLEELVAARGGADEVNMGFCIMGE